MKRVIIGIFCLMLSGISLTAEVRVSVNSEFYNIFSSQSGIEDDWNYMLTGSAGLSLRNKGSRAVRGEVSLDFSEAGASLHSSLKKLYIRPAFGDVLASLGKTRTTWGAGFAFNAGDVIFGSDSVDFDSWSSDPRSETAWLTNAEFPLGDFSFLEIIALPGNMDFTDPAATVMPTISDASAGARISIEAGDFNIQSGYLYRGDEIANLGSAGQRAYISLEGISPINWHLSTSTATEHGSFSIGKIKESFMITGGCSWDHLLGYARDITLTWQFEYLAKPFKSFADDSSGEYGLYLFPSITFIPGGTVGYSISSIISPIDMSANTTAGFNWNIYEELTLTGYCSIQTGDEGDIFNLHNSAGMSCILGAKYSY